MTALQLRRLLRRLDLTQVEAARRLGVDPRTMRRWVAGDSRIPEAVAIVLRHWASQP
jgi:plasmid maintenance system antidote protein VapI